MHERTKQLLLTLSIAGLVVGGSGLAIADYGTAPVLDTSGTDDTASVSELQPGDTLGANNTFEANSSNNVTIQWISNSNETQAEVMVNGSDHATYTNATPTTVVYNATDGDGHFNATMAHSALLDSDHAINSNVTYDVMTTNNTTLDSPDTNTEQFYVEWDNSTSVKHVSAADVNSDTVEVVNESGPFGLTTAGLGKDMTTIEATDRAVNGSNTDIIVTFSDSNVSDDFAAAAEGKDTAAKMSGLTTFTRNVVIVENADGERKAVPVYNSEAPDSVESSDTYAVYKSGAFGGSDGVMVNLGDDYSDADQVSVEAAGSAGLTDYITETALAGVNSIAG